MAEIKGLNELKKNLDIFKRQTFDLVKKAIQESAIMIQNEAKQNHGENAHATNRYIDRTANLTNSIQATIAQETIDKIMVNVIAGMQYASSVELGTVKSRPFPFLFPAYEKNGKILNESIKNIISRIKWIKK